MASTTRAPSSAANCRGCWRKGAGFAAVEGLDDLDAYAALGGFQNSATNGFQKLQAKERARPLNMHTWAGRRHCRPLSEAMPCTPRWLRRREARPSECVVGAGHLQVPRPFGWQPQPDEGRNE